MNIIKNRLIFICIVVFIITINLVYAGDGTMPDIPINKLKIFSSQSTNNHGNAALIETTWNGSSTFMLWVNKDTEGMYKNIIAALLQAKSAGNNVTIEYYEVGGGYNIRSVQIIK